MGNVNVNFELLQDTYGNMQTAIVSIERTIDSIQKSYRELGEGWKDKKYIELGETVENCVRSLRNIYKPLLQGEKYVLSLMKSVEEYESVNLKSTNEGDGSFVQRIRDLTNPANRLATNELMGVLTKGNFPDEYPSVLMQRHQSAEQNVRRVFDNFVEKLSVQDAEYSVNLTPHYSPRNYVGHERGVYYNAVADMNNPRGAGTTYYHELGHMVDHASTGYGDYLSNTIQFRNALIEDGRNVLNLYSSLGVEGRQAFNARIRQDESHSLSDLLDATTNGQIHGRYGHGREYWNREGSLQAEAFAHFFEASMGGGIKLEMLSNFFPTAFAIFTNMIESILPRENILVR